MSPALVAGFLTTGPPGKPSGSDFYNRGSDGGKEMEVVVMEVVAVEMGMEVVIEART